MTVTEQIDAAVRGANFAPVGYRGMSDPMTLADNTARRQRAIYAELQRCGITPQAAAQADEWIATFVCRECGELIPLGDQSFGYGRRRPCTDCCAQ